MKKSIVFFVKKILRMASLLVALCLLAFILMKCSPVDPIRAYVGADMLQVSPMQRAQIAEYWGIDKPPVEQFLHWSLAVAQGDLGTSMIFRRPVTEVIYERFLASLCLMGAAWLLSGGIGFVLGVVAGMRRGTWVDQIITLYCYVLASTPTFWLGLLLLMVFAVWLNWFPVGLGVPAGMLANDVTWSDRVQHLVLPVLTLSILGVANVALHTRQKLVDVLASDYVLFARARGEEGLVLFLRHGLRNATLPAITLQFASFSELFGGAVLAEQVFSYPGLGQTIVEAGLRGDVPLLLGIVIFSSVFVFSGNMLADLMYFIIDPRIRGEAKV